MQLQAVCSNITGDEAITHLYTNTSVSQWQKWEGHSGKENTQKKEIQLRKLVWTEKMSEVRVK